MGRKLRAVRRKNPPRRTGNRRGNHGSCAVPIAIGAENKAVRLFFYGKICAAQSQCFPQLPPRQLSLPYLKSVDSAEDKAAPGYETEVSFSTKEVLQQLKTQGTPTQTAENLSIEILSQPFFCQIRRAVLAHACAVPIAIGAENKAVRLFFYGKKTTGSTPQKSAAPYGKPQGKSWFMTESRFWRRFKGGGLNPLCRKALPTAALPDGTRRTAG